jgi:hypothetical protein
LTACRPEAPSAPPAATPLATVEVGAAPDATADLSRDTVGRAASSERMAGVLPGGFPADLPIPAGTSIVDFGTLAAASPTSSYLTLRSPQAATTLLGSLRRSLAAAGWTLAQEQGSWRLRKGNREVVLSVVDAHPGAEIRYAYTPR